MSPSDRILLALINRPSNLITAIALTAFIAEIAVCSYAALGLAR